jgi:hypothetical protein
VLTGILYILFLKASSFSGNFVVLVPVSFYLFFLNMWWIKGVALSIFFILVWNYASLGFWLKKFLWA